MVQTGDPTITEILMSALSLAMEDGTLSVWHVQGVDSIFAGHVLTEIDTDKATLDFEQSRRA